MLHPPLTASQELLYDEFVVSVQDVIDSSHEKWYLLKWLRARKFNVQKAADMYRKSMAWRREMGADTLLQTYQTPEVMKKYYPGGLCGQDKDGCPIWIDPMCAGDIRGILYSVKKTDVIRCLVFRLEELNQEFERRTKEADHVIDQCVQIIDMEDFSSSFMWRPALHLYVEIVQMLERNYPDTLKRTYIIKAPRLFRVAFNVFKRFIDSDTAQKFQFLGNDWKSVLSAECSDQLPVFYGGSLTDPDGNPKCESRISYGGRVPLEFYQKKEEFFPSEPHKHHLGRYGTLTLAFSMPRTNSAIRYVFSVDSGDIEFGVYTDSGPPDIDPGTECREVQLQDHKYRGLSGATEVQPRTKLDCQRVPEDGMVIVDTPGFYYLHFVNPSLMSKRTLLLVTEIAHIDQVNASSSIESSTSL